MEDKTHYVYRLHLEKTGEYYIGVRSCYGYPEHDPYKGSMVTWKVDNEELSKIILGVFDTRKEAEQMERLLIDCNIRNPLNRNYSGKFGTSKLHRKANLFAWNPHAGILADISN